MDEQRVVERRSSVTTPPTDSSYTTHETTSEGSVVSETVRHTPSAGEVARRAVVFLFGIVQALIGIRIVLLLIWANPANGLVRFIYDTSAFFIGPFEGVLHTNAVSAGHSILDIAALVALVGWTILEILVIALVRVGRREP